MIFYCLDLNTPINECVWPLIKNDPLTLALRSSLLQPHTVNSEHSKKTPPSHQVPDPAYANSEDAQALVDFCDSRDGRRPMMFLSTLMPKPVAEEGMGRGTFFDGCVSSWILQKFL